LYSHSVGIKPMLLPVFDIKLRGHRSVRNMGRFLSLRMIDSETEWERDVEREEPLKWLMKDRPVGPTYTHNKKQNNNH
jgi:hypothetical protein